ncbi:MAG: hypothetical protein LUE24_00775 [Lachnospiraceae bacterium]|nr:hypothetical protein [Lachnospiraceae bacterium]
MSSVSQNQNKGNEISSFAEKFIHEFHIGKLLFKCIAGEEKGIPVMNIFRHLLCLIFSDRSDYMQRKTGTSGCGFSKNIMYRFLNENANPPAMLGIIE